MLTVISVILAYLIGSISCSIIICKITKHPDPRTQGSGNAGATNVLRFAGKKLALLTLLGDITKGIIAVLLARLFGQQGFMLALSGVAVFLGHLYPIFFKFHGGKGIATGLGVMLALSPLLGICSLITWLIVASIFRYSSLASLVTFTLAPFYSFIFARPIYAYFLPLVVITILVFWKHRANIKRLKLGIESKIGH